VRAALWGALLGAGAGYASTGGPRGAAGGAVVGAIVGFGLEAVAGFAGLALPVAAGAMQSQRQLASGNEPAAP
jgi:hypothetical protein